MADPTTTKDRLLRAAGEEFARSGFQGASVRAICDAAGSNVSGIKYHFGSKEGLYREVMMWAAQQQLTSNEPPPSLEEDGDPRAALTAMMAWFLRRLLTPRENDWTAQLMAHEAVHPSPVLASVVETFAFPIRNAFLRIIRELVSESLSTRELNDVTNGVLALCVNLKNSRAILTCFGSPPPTEVDEINRMAATLARFALSGLNGFADEGETSC